MEHRRPSWSHFGLLGRSNSSRTPPSRSRGGGRGRGKPLPEGEEGVVGRGKKDIVRPPVAQRAGGIRDALFARVDPGRGPGNDFERTPSRRRSEGLVSRFLVLVNQDLELVEIQFQPILYLILLVPFLQVQLINHLRQHHPKKKKNKRLRLH